MVSVSGYLIGSQESGKMPLPPKAELEWWYQFYFATERGRTGYDKYRHDFSKLIWQLASPKWDFDDATFDRSAASFNNQDHVAIVMHNYRWRLALAEGEPKYDDLDKRLAQGPVITILTLTHEGDTNGAPHSDPSVTDRFVRFWPKAGHIIVHCKCPLGSAWHGPLSRGSCAARANADQKLTTSMTAWAKACGAS